MRLSRDRGLIAKRRSGSETRLVNFTLKMWKQTTKHSAIFEKFGGFLVNLTMAFMHYHAGCTQQARLEWPDCLEVDILKNTPVTPIL